MKQKPAPDSILKMIFCNCKSGCMRETCTCKKSGLLCFSICKTCAPATCKNFPQILNESEEDDEDDENDGKDNEDDFI